MTSSHRLLHLLLLLLLLLIHQPVLGELSITDRSTTSVASPPPTPSPTVPNSAVVSGTPDGTSASEDAGDVDDEESIARRISYVCLCYDFVIEAVLMGVLCIFGFAGNSLSMVCLWRDRSKTATPFLLVSLAVADTLFLATVLFLRVLTSIHPFAVDLPWLTSVQPYLGKYVYPSALIAETGTIYLTILVTVNRYVSVCWPYRASDLCSIRNARLHVAAVAVFAVLFNVSRFFEYEIVGVHDYEDEEATTNSTMLSDAFSTTAAAAAFWFQHNLTSVVEDSELPDGFDRVPPTDETLTISGRALNKSGSFLSDNSTNTAMYSNESSTSSFDGYELQITALAVHRIYRLVYLNLLYFVVMFFVPLVSLIFLNQRLVAELRKTRKRRTRLRGVNGNIGEAGGTQVGNGGGVGGDARSEEDITFMLVVVVIVFVVTQMPAAVTQTLASTHDIGSLLCPSSYFFYERISDLLVVANSSSNFLVYCLCSRRFRRILWRVVCQPSAAVGRAGTRADESAAVELRSLNHRRQHLQLPLKQTNNVDVNTPICTSSRLES